MWVTLGLFLGHQFHELGAGHLAQHAGRQGVRPVVVFDIDVQTVHDVEMGVGKQFFHGGIADLGIHPALHEGLEIRFGGQPLHIVHARQAIWCRRWRLGLGRLRSCRHRRGQRRRMGRCHRGRQIGVGIGLALGLRLLAP